MTAARTIPATDITAVSLAGGRARRMDGTDKDLPGCRGRPLIEPVIAAGDLRLHDAAGPRAAGS